VPVVSTPIPEAQQYSEVIEIARGADGFTRAIQECLSGDNKDRISRQVAIAREQTWNNRAQQRLAIMEDYLERKVSGKTTS
jgi:hypothetical protein